MFLQNHEFIPLRLIVNFLVTEGILSKVSQITPFNINNIGQSLLRHRLSTHLLLF